MKRSAEAENSHQFRIESGFYDKYMSGCGVDIGFRGYSSEDVVPVLPSALGVDKKFPGYDGITLPFKDDSVDYVFSSHMLEHVQDYKNYIRDWYRVTRVGGHIIIIVPHQYLYEKVSDISIGSKWNGDHKRFYTPSSLLKEVEDSLAPNSYRVVHLMDNDRGFDYKKGPEIHSGGCYEIECVIKKIRKPHWDLLGS